MKSFLITSAITIFVLALFFQFGNALVCYKCPFQKCNTNVTCSADQDACIVVRLGGRNVSDCWKYSDCNEKFIESQFHTGTFRYRCCSWNLCNDAPTIVSSKIVLSLAFLLIVVQMLHF